MQAQDFEVHIRSNSSTPEEWKRAMEAPVTELLPLDEEQKEVAKKFKIAEEEYARGELARIYGQRRLRERGEQLGKVVQNLLEQIGTENRLLAVLYEGVKLRWIVRVETRRGIRNVSIPRELADDVLDSELFDSVQQVKARLLSGLAE